MQNTILLASALAGLAYSQSFDFAAILDAPSPSVTGPPIDAINATTVAINTAAVAVSISAEVVPTTASVTGAAASAASTEQPPAGSVEKRGNWGHKTTTLKTSTKPVTSAPVSSLTSSTISVDQPTTVTTFSTSACPTTPEVGTYCGFINPEDACASQPDGYGPKVQPDTVEAFKAYPEFHSDAKYAIIPAGYEQTFVDLDAATSANSYITFYTLQSYDVQNCASHCDETELCTAFNIYIERDPSLNPTVNDTDPTFNCPNPSSITNYKCSLWGSSIDETTATNTGGYRGDEFEVVIVGSNGYDKTNNTTPAPPPGWQPPNKCPGGAITDGGAYHVGGHFFPGPFNPGLCGIFAKAQAAENKAAAVKAGKHSFTPVNMFQAYMVQLNGKPQGTQCSLFNADLKPSWGKFGGAWSGKDRFDVKNAWTFASSSPDKGEW